MRVRACYYSVARPSNVSTSFWISRKAAHRRSGTIDMSQFLSVASPRWPPIMQQASSSCSAVKRWSSPATDPLRSGSPSTSLRACSLSRAVPSKRTTRRLGQSTIQIDPNLLSLASTSSKASQPQMSNSSKVLLGQCRLFSCLQLCTMSLLSGLSGSFSIASSLLPLQSNSLRSEQAVRSKLVS